MESKNTQGSHSPVIHKFETVDSTNDEAKRYVASWRTLPAHKGQEGGMEIPGVETLFPDTIILAETQTRGKGRMGRHWYSPPGNLYMTLIKSLPVSLNKLPQLSLVVGLAVHRVLKTIVSSDHHVAVKWPNDILIDGQKISGILIETDFQTDSKKDAQGNDEAEITMPLCYIGVGLNRLSAPTTISYPTCCLLDFTQSLPTLDDLVSQIMGELSALLDLWMEKGLKEIREEWLWSAYGLGKPVSAHVENGFMLYGRFVSLDAEGAILIEDEDHHTHTVRNPDIQYMV